MNRPEQNEHHPFFQPYLDLVREGAFLNLLEENTNEVKNFFSNISFTKHDFKYAENKWSIKEILMHLIDTERVFAYRALVCARGDKESILPNMDEKLYAANVDVANRKMESLIEEFLCVRKNSFFLFENINEQQSLFLGKGAASPFTARALGFCIIGHSQHHINTITKKYL